MATIHPTAVVSDGAEIGAECQIGPYCVIGQNVTLGSKTVLDSHVVVQGHTTIGSENRIFPFASIGTDPQDLKFHGEPSKLTVGDRNIIREYVTLQPGTEGGGMLTSIGNENLFMASSHLGHDSVVGDNNIFANSVAVSGHVEVGNRVTVGGLAGVHQFTRLGDHAFIAAGAMVAQDIPPYCLAHGNRAELIGLNQVGLKRGGWEADEISVMRKVYRELLLGDGILRERLERVSQEFGSLPRAKFFLDFVKSSERGIATARLKGGEE